MGSVLIVDDEAGMRGMLEVVLRRDGHEVRCAANPSEALGLLDEAEAGLILTDLRMDDTSGLDGLGLLERVRRDHPHCFVIVMTAYAEWDTAVHAMRLGAFNFLNKPFDNDVLRALCSRAFEAREHYLAAREAGEQEPAVHLVGTSSTMNDIQAMIEQVSTTDASVLVTGPSGSGKELVSRAIHYGSLRADGPLVRVNAGALTPSLLESELFGHVKGAFTGAIEDRPGLFSLANKGTLFLDEVGELAIETQVKLLRVLEANEYLPVGSHEIQTCDVRVVAATNKSLKDMVAAGSFREDLYYRLAVITIELPGLAKRREDIPLLAGHLLARHAVRLRRGITGFTQDAIEAMNRYAWPGNIRELDNRIQRGAALTSEGDIDAEALFGDISDQATDMWRTRDTEASSPGRRSTAAGQALERKTTSDRRRSTQTGAETGREARNLAAHLRADGTVDIEEEIKRFEKKLVAAALEATDNNLTEAAKRLGLSFRQIRYKVKQLGLR